MYKKEQQFSISDMEEKILEFWDSQKIFEKTLEQTKDSQPFTFYDGPPFATGLPHYGHILASTIKDLIPRYQTMKGHFVRRRWGWDCHGLPIEEIVERKLGISGKKEIEKIGIKKFNELCRSTVLQYAEEWGKTVRRVARWVEFKDSYKTMDASYMESVWWAFKQLYEKDLIYEGRRVLMYCSRCETPISNFEVAMDNSYKDVDEESVYVKFKVKSSKLKVDNAYLLAWTTTPWTLPGNVALAVGKDIEYAHVEMNGEMLILAKSLISKIGGGKEIKTLKGSDLVGVEYEPLFDVPKTQSDKAYKVYAADFVTTEEGTGIVHTAVMYGEDDYKLGMKVGLPTVPMLDEKGIFNDEVPSFIRGKGFKESEKFIKKDLEERKLLFKRENHKHAYPHCWRCSNPLFYNAIPAWFVNIEKIKKGLLKSNDKEINWFPEHLKHGRYQKSVEAAPDWNISRNRYWGNPIPVWKCDLCQRQVVVGSLEELGGYTSGVLPKNDAGEVDLHRPYIDEVQFACKEKGCKGVMRRTPEIFDSWMEAASMPFAEYHYPFENKKVFESRLPAQFVAEYIAQTRAWFYVMHVVSYVLFKKAPFENVVTTGTILAEDGSKMSKSKNNFPDPAIVIQKYGADSLRFYLMNSVVMQADNLNFSEKEVQEVYRKVVMILLNVYNYYATYIAQVDLEADIEKKDNLLDQWITIKTNTLVTDVTRYLDIYDTVRATRAIQEYVDGLSTWYLRRSRKRKDKAFFNTLRNSLMIIARIIAPVMPFLAEEIYQKLKTKDDAVSVHLTEWPQAEKQRKHDEEFLRQMDEVRRLASIVLGKRAMLTLKVRQPLASLTLRNNTLKGADALLDILKDEVNVKEVLFNKKLKDEVELDAVITPELKEEGIVREFIRTIQGLRQDAGYKPGEIMTLMIDAPSFQAVLQKKELALKKEIGARSIEWQRVSQFDAELVTKLEGQDIWLAVRK